MGQLLHWESALERAAFILLDLDPAVIRYREQPAHIEYDDGDHQFAHFPDLLIQSCRSTDFAEVKPTHHANDETIRTRARLLGHHLADFGFGYYVLSEDELTREPRLHNAHLIRRYAYADLRAGLTERLFAEAQSEPLTWGALATDAETLAAACRLIAAGHLTFPWDEPIGQDTQISVTTET